MHMNFLVVLKISLFVFSHITVLALKIYLPKESAQFPLRCHRKTQLASVKFDGKTLHGVLLLSNRSQFYRRIPYLELFYGYGSQNRRKKIEVASLVRTIPRKLENESFIKTAPITIDFEANWSFPDLFRTFYLEVHVLWKEDELPCHEVSFATLYGSKQLAMSSIFHVDFLHEFEQLALIDVCLKRNHLEGTILTRKLAINISQCTVSVVFTCNKQLHTIIAAFEKPFSIYYNQYQFQVPIEVFQDSDQFYINSICLEYSAFGIPVKNISNNNGKGYWFIVSKSGNFEEMKYIKYNPGLQNHQDLLEIESPYLYSLFGFDVLNLGELLRQRKFFENSLQKTIENSDNLKSPLGSPKAHENPEIQKCKVPEKRVRFVSGLRPENNDRRYKHTKLKRNFGTVSQVKNYNMLLSLINDVKISFHEKFYCCYRLAKSLLLIKDTDVVAAKIIPFAINAIKPLEFKKKRIRNLMLEFFYVELIKIPLLNPSIDTSINSIADLQRLLDVPINNYQLDFSGIEEKIQLLELLFYKICKKIELIYLACKFKKEEKEGCNSYIKITVENTLRSKSTDNSKNSKRSPLIGQNLKKIVKLNEKADFNSAIEYFFKESGFFSRPSSSEIIDFLEETCASSNFSLLNIIRKEISDDLSFENIKEIITLYELNLFVSNRQYDKIFSKTVLSVGKIEEIRRMVQWHTCGIKMLQTIDNFVDHIKLTIESATENFLVQSKMTKDTEMVTRDYFLSMLKTIFGNLISYSSDGLDSFKTTESTIRFTLVLIELLKLPQQQMDLIKPVLDQ